jgi:hypothetical protein
MNTMTRTKDEMYAIAKETYSHLSSGDLQELDLPDVFDLLSTRQKELFMNFFSLAEQSFREELDPKLESEFINEVERELGFTGGETVEDIIHRMNVKICKF